MASWTQYSSCHVNVPASGYKFRFTCRRSLTCVSYSNECHISADVVTDIRTKTPNATYDSECMGCYTSTVVDGFVIHFCPPSLDVFVSDWINFVLHECRNIF